MHFSTSVRLKRQVNRISDTNAHISYGVRRRACDGEVRFRCSVKAVLRSYESGKEVALLLKKISPLF